MRLKIVLSVTSVPVEIPVNYTYLLHNEIKNKISSHKDIFRDPRLKKLGIQTGRFRAYTFSFLKFKNFLIEQDKIRLEKGEEFNFFISSPFDSFIEGMAIALLRDGVLRLGEQVFLIKGISRVSPPDFKEEMSFKLLSPIAVLRKQISEGGKRYITPDEKGYVERIKEDLVQKFKIIYGKEIKPGDFLFEYDKNYIASHGGKYSKLIRFGNSYIKCFLAPFVVRTEPELIKVGYEWGFGHNNHFGLGMPVISESTGS